MESTAYMPRIADSMLDDRLRIKGAVVIEGAKWCGKTTTAEQKAASDIHMDEPGRSEELLLLADMLPQQILTGAAPRLIDEWQIAPVLWDAVRYEVDRRGQPGQFILTGSAVPASTERIKHTGAGRFEWLLMRPMSLYESGESNGDVSLRDLFNAPPLIDGRCSIEAEELAYLICRGGWPGAVAMKGKDALEHAFSYCDAIARSDISRADGVSRRPDRVRRFLRAYARNLGTQASNATLAEDIKANEGASLSSQTVNAYVAALSKIFVVEEMEAWNPNLRSKTAIRTSPTRYFVDPSIAAAALEAGPEDLINDMETLGFLFETLCVRDLRVFAEAIHGRVYHFRDKTDLECDAVIHLRSGVYGLVEIKLGGKMQTDAGAQSLLRLRDKIDTTKMHAPRFLMVLTGLGHYAYRRKDGVYVVPIGCLKD